MITEKAKNDFKQKYSLEIANATNVLKGLDGYSGYVLYFYDSEKLSCEIRPLPSVKPVLEINKTAEIFCLSDIAFYLNGKPVFIVMRSFPFSISMELLEKEKIRTLVSAKYTSADVKAKLDSIYINKVFNRRKVEVASLLIMFLTNVITGLVVYLSFGNFSKPIQTLTNSTLGV